MLNALFCPLSPRRSGDPYPLQLIPTTMAAAAAAATPGLGPLQLQVRDKKPQESTPGAFFFFFLWPLSSLSAGKQAATTFRFLLFFFFFCSFLHLGHAIGNKSVHPANDVPPAPTKTLISMVRSQKSPKTDTCGPPPPQPPQVWACDSGWKTEALRLTVSAEL